MEAMETQNIVGEQPYTNIEPVLYAGFWIRFVAALIDGIALQIVFSILNLAITGSLLDMPTYLEMLMNITSFVYYIVLTGLYGQTLGKMALGLKVVRQDGQPLGWGTVILRELLGKIVSAIIILIGYIMAGFDSKKRALHDRISSTYVVKVSM
jgi:uncharacterized RDD family membrane protein YckC